MIYKKSYFPDLFLILFFLFLYLPLLNVMYSSVFINNSFDLSGYKELFLDQEIFYAFLNSLLVASLTVILSLTICLFSIKYFFLNKKSNLLIYLTLPNLIIPENVLAIGLLLFFTFLNFKFGLITLIISHTVLSIGYMMPLLYQRWLELNKLHIIAAYDLGASNNYVWKTIVLTFLKPTIIATSFLSFILSFDDYVFSYFCSSVETITIINPLLNLLRTGLTPKLKACAFIIFLFSFFLGLLYMIYVGFIDENK